MGTKVKNIRMTQTRQSLINAFINLVNEKDFEKITIADLTKGAQVNRATFYAHFNDKYELLDYIVDESASAVVEKRTSGVVKFDEESLRQLVLAVCDYHQQPNIQCRRSYLSLIPQLKEKMLIELNKYLSNCLAAKYTDVEKSLYVPISASIILEAGYLWASGNVSFDKETIANKVSLLIWGGYHFSEKVVQDIRMAGEDT
ncbi:TetR family transcriptional regulator [Paenibacillus sp. BIHB 4019]|uniref:TetR family transcriptional regulator n=1 Tax=Paenibacillus sp. BIHB 4019 TaxID=1870819 RepID=A0A1B2DNB1_9BACL|nr:TetR/AcrR family transcriptional regulator [Paenibacillus sp. BIHB 4019]ANY69196.1 TetR family transcriptional regulator [Paenibacillus sp. BIHB 4019]